MAAADGARQRAGAGATAAGRRRSRPPHAGLAGRLVAGWQLLEQHLLAPPALLCCIAHHVDSPSFAPHPALPHTHTPPPPPHGSALHHPTHHPAPTPPCPHPTRPHPLPRGPSCHRYGATSAAGCGRSCDWGTAAPPLCASWSASRWAPWSQRTTVGGCGGGGVRYSRAFGVAEGLAASRARHVLRAVVCTLWGQLTTQRSTGCTCGRPARAAPPLPPPPPGAASSA